MIRFCDKDVFCVEYGRINRSELLRYFLAGNLDEVVCVLDADGRYSGHITYWTLIQNEKAEYLLWQKISVKVEGSMWKGFLESDDREYMDYNCMTIYAEGVWNRSSNWMENFLRSVSVEFECIDHIYEEKY